MSRLRQRRGLWPFLLSSYGDGGAGGGTAWSPSQLGGLQLWLKADAGTFQDSGGTTPAVNNGDVVGSWTDQSTNGNNAIQATTANKPTLATNVLNGLPGVSFNGTTSFMRVADALGLRITTQGSIFAVCKFAATSNQTLLCKGVSAASPDYLYSGFRAGSAHPSSMSLFDHTAWYDFATSSIDISHYFLLELTYGARTLNYYVDANPISTLATTEDWGSSANPLYLGIQVSTNFCNMILNELVMTNTTVSTADRQSLEAYFQTRYLV